MRRATTQRLARLFAGLGLVLFGATAWAVDSDSDGLTDAVEDELGSNPGDSDTDDDGWSDYLEVTEKGTNVLLDDSDLDTVPDPEDEEPLDPGDELDGVDPPNFDGYPTTSKFAFSGESPRVGAGVHVNSGVMLRSFSVGRTAGIETVTLRPGSEPPLPSASSAETEFSLDIIARSDSKFDGRTGLGLFAPFIDTTYTVVGGNFKVLREDGQQVTYVLSGGTFTSPAGMRDTLTLASGVYTRTTPEGAKWVYSGGVWTQYIDPFGNTITPTYTSGKVTSIADARGRTHTLTYYAATGRLYELATADGATWHFFYNLERELMRVEGPDATYPAGGQTLSFLYVNGDTSSALHGNLAVEIDGRGKPAVRTQYDENDRVVAQEFGAWDRILTIDYTNASSQSVTVTDPVGNEKVWTWDSTKLTKTSLTEKTNRGVRSGEGDYTTSWTHNAAGYLLTQTLPLGNGVKYTLNSVQLPTERRRKQDMAAADGSNDIVVSWAYDSSKNYGITSFTDPQGDITTYTLNSKGQPTAVAYPDITHFTPDQEIELGYTYNGDGTMASATNGEGFVTTYDYYSSGANNKLLWQTTVDSGSGHLNLVSEIDYTTWGDPNEWTDARGNVTTATVERYGNPTSILSPSSLGYEKQIQWNGNLYVTKIRTKNIDWDGTWLSSPQWWDTTFTYSNVNDDLINIVEAITSTTIRTTAFGYDKNHFKTSQQRGTVRVEWTPDERGLLYQRVMDPASIAATDTYAWDANGNLSSRVNRLGKATSVSSDLFDRPEQITNALGDYEVRIYDKSGNLTEQKWYDELGATDVLMAHHKNTFDEIGRRWKEEDLLKGVTDTWYTRTFTHDKRHLMTAHNDRRGYDTLHEYDGAGRLIEETDAAGNIRAYALDENSNVVTLSVTEKLHGTSTTETYETDLTWDAMNRLVQKAVIDRTNSSNQLVTQYKLDALNFLRKVIDPRGHETVNSRDGLARRTQRVVDLGSSATAVTQWTLDIHDNVTRLRDDNNNDTDYLYDSLNQWIRKTYESTKTVEVTRNDGGQAITIVDQNGSQIDQDFDDIGNLIARDFTLASGVGGVTYEDFVRDALGRVTQAKNDHSIVNFVYDSLSRVVSEEQGSNPLGSTGKTVTNTMDAEGNLTHIAYPSGFNVERTYAEIAMLTELEDGSANSIAAFTHWGPHHRMSSVTFGNGTNANYGYDGFRRADEILHKTSGSTEFAGFDYGYDENGNPLYEARSHQSSGHGDVYTYDYANRLTRTLTDVVDPAAEIATPSSQTYAQKLDYNMDDVFNLTSYVVTPYGGSATTTSYTTNSMNQYTAVGAASPTYDDNGNLVNDGTKTFKYDIHNHLIEVRRNSDSQVLMTAKHDAVGRGRRFEKTDTLASVTTRTIYRGEDAIEDYVSGTLARLFVYDDMIDRPVMMEAPDVADVDSDSNTSELKRFYYHTQLIGSVTHVTDPSQNVVESYTYDPYGATVIKNQGGSTISATAIGNPWGFTGRQYDAEVGLYHYRARAYSPALRRFIQRDPLEYVDGPNAYAYAGGRPTVVADPSGTIADTRFVRDGWDNASRALRKYGNNTALADAMDTWRDKVENFPPAEELPEELRKALGMNHLKYFPLLGIPLSRSIYLRHPIDVPVVNGKVMNCPCTVDDWAERVLGVDIHEAQHAIAGGVPNTPAAEVAASNATIDALQGILDNLGENPDCPCGCDEPWDDAAAGISKAIKFQQDYRDFHQEILDAEKAASEK